MIDTNTCGDLVRLFREYVAASPLPPAVNDCGRTITYRELDRGATTSPLA